MLKNFRFCVLFIMSFVIFSCSSSSSSNNITGEASKSNLIVSAWECTLKYVAYEKQYISIYDIEYFADGTYFSEPKDEDACSSAGTWYIDGDMITYELTSVSGHKYCIYNKGEPVSETITEINANTFKTISIINEIEYNVTCN